MTALFPPAAPSPRAPVLINLEAVAKAFGEKVLFDGVSLGVHAEDRIGVVGLNGSGKSTLLELLAGVEQPDTGRVSQARDLRLAVVTQRGELEPAASVRETVLAGYGADHEWAADARVRSIVDGLGVGSLGWDSPVGRLSGGQRRRVALAAALVRELDLLILDEPTNHLDVEGIAWLAEHLLTRRVALVVVTHDRWFLDTVCGRTWEVAGAGVQQYEGGYSDWVFARAERARLAAATEDKRLNLARKELAWLRRGARARTSKPRYRVEAAEALIADVPPLRDTVELHAFAQRRLGKTVLELEDVTVRLGDRTLLDDVTWRIGPGDRFGLVGVNGSGKTTLLRLLAGALQPDAGRLVRGKTVRLAWLAQELEDLPSSLRVLEAVEEVARRVVLGKQELSASQLAERFGFPAKRQWTPVADLSGGERRRLQLARLLMAEPNVLLLDEPTNDLDIDTLQQLEDLLDGWPGTLIVVSHDRYLLERVSDTVVGLLGDGSPGSMSLTHLPGGIEQYLSQRAAGVRVERRQGHLRGVERPQGGLDSTPVGPTAAEQRAARKELARLERRLDVLHKQEEKLHAALAAAATDPERLLALDVELKGVLAEKDAVEQSWMGLADAAE